nr:signal peptidase I [Ruminococcus sp.]
MKFGRVTAFAGDTVEITGESVPVNGMGIYEQTVYHTTAEGQGISYPYTVPENSVFVMNDYREDLSDSRTAGAIPLEDLRGKVFLIMRTSNI